MSDEKNQSQVVKDYCEQEGITHDDIINAEIEEEHRSALEQGSSSSPIAPAHVAQDRAEIQVLDLNTYTKRPVAIKAAQLTEIVWNTIDENCARKIFEINGQAVQAYRKADGKKAFMLQTLEGPMQADIYDWLIIGIKGEIYACKPDIFEKTYNETSCSVI